MKKYLLILIFGLVFFLPHYSYAAVWGSQTDVSSGTTIGALNYFTGTPTGGIATTTSYLGFVTNDYAANYMQHVTNVNLAVLGGTDSSCLTENIPTNRIDIWQLTEEGTSTRPDGKEVVIFKISGNGLVNSTAWDGFTNNYCYAPGLGNGNSPGLIYGENSNVTWTNWYGGTDTQQRIAYAYGDTITDVENALGSNTPQNPTITFNFPTNGTTTIPFNYLSALTSNLTSTDQYVITENTSYNSGVLGIGGTKNITGGTITNSGAYFSRFGYVTAFPVITDNGFGTNFSMISNIQLYDITGTTFNLGVSQVLATDTIQWYLIPYINNGQNEVNGTSSILDNFPIYIQATSTNPVITPYNGSSYTSTATTTPYNAYTSFCPAPASITDIGNGLLYAGCNLINVALNPNVIPQSVTFLSDQFTNLKNDPPFSAFFGLASSVQTAASVASTTYGTVSIEILGYPNQQLTDIVDVNSTTFNNGIGGSTHTTYPTSNAVNYLETYISMTLWIATGIKVLWIFTH